MIPSAYADTFARDHLPPHVGGLGNVGVIERRLDRRRLDELDRRRGVRRRGGEHHCEASDGARLHSVVHSTGIFGTRRSSDPVMIKLLLWLLLFFLCWPLALLALVLYPLVWLVLLPFRLLGIAVEGVFELLRALILLPARALGSRP